MFMAEFDKRLRKWRAVSPDCGRVDVVVIRHAPAAKVGAFVNPRAVLSRQNAMLKQVRAVA